MKIMYIGLIAVSLLLFIANIFDLFFLEITVVVLIGTIAIWSQFAGLKKIRISRLIWIGVFVLGIVLATASLFYYVYRPSVELISIGWLRVICTWALMIITLLGVSILLHQGVKKLATTKNN